jgi:hypothetical protein
MTDHLEPNAPGHSTTARGPHSSASLIQVAASEQLASGALRHCPVCGLPYVLESLLAPSQQTAITLDERLVFLCARCGAYSVGALAGASEG